MALVVINMAVSFLVPNISWQGHLGGLITGVLVALIIAKSPRRNRALWTSVGFSGLILGLLGLTLAGIQLVPLPNPASLCPAAGGLIPQIPQDPVDNLC